MRSPSPPSAGDGQSAAANFVATAPDPVGDSADPHPGRDIVALGLAYDRRKGELIGAVQLGGSAASDTSSLLTIVAASRTATGCDGFPALGFATYTDEWTATWHRIDDAAGAGAHAAADKRGGPSQVQRFETVSRDLRGRRPNCVVARLTEPGNPAAVYDATDPIPLVAQPVLSLRIGDVPDHLQAGKARTVKLILANDGEAKSAPIRLSFARARGLRVRVPSKRLKPIAPRKRVVVRATVTAGARAAFATELKVKATAGRIVLREQETLYVRQPSKPGSGGGGGSPAPGGRTCVRFMPDLTGQTGGSLGLVPC